MKVINNHFIPVKKEFDSNLRNNGRAVIDLFERKLAQRKGYDIVQPLNRNFLRENMVPQRVKYGAYGAKIVKEP